MGCSASSTAASGPNGNANKIANGNASANGAAKGQTAEDQKKARKMQLQSDKEAAERENKDYKGRMQFLAQVPLLKRLPPDLHPLLAGCCIPTDFQANNVIIKQGDLGSEFYVIVTGEAKVDIDTDGKQVTVATLKAGDYFGENALLRDEPRTATITAESQMSTLKITRDEFQRLGLHEKLQFANRKAVGGGGVKRDIIAKPPTKKIPKERELIERALRANQSLNTMVTMDDDRVNSMIDVAWKQDVKPGTDIIVQGDLVADFFYIVQSGTFEIYVAEAEDPVEDEPDPVSPRGKAEVRMKEPVFLGTVEEGGSFGELALLYLVPRAATIRARTKGVVWVFDRTNFKNILMKVSDDKVAEYVAYINNTSLLQPLMSDEKKAVAEALIEMTFSKDDVILQQGEPGNTFYILSDGDVRVLVDNDQKAVLSASKANKTTQFFGERALLNSEPRAATIVVKSDHAKVLALDRDSFNMLLGPLQDLINRAEGDAAGSGLKSADERRAAAMSGSTLHAKKILKKDLQRIGLLGCGGFGAVELWEHKVTKDTYALKGVSKGFVVKMNMQESIMNEKEILMMTNSPFIIKLYATYNGTQTLYFLMEAALGGELYSTYNRRGFHGSEKHAKFYVAGVVLAFEHCHERHIIYRDLKPENLLFNEQGHLKVTDMGLAKFVIGKTFTTCGTPEYFAPELIACTGHSNAVDWWALGILIYELFTGTPPFAAQLPMQIYAKVMKGINQVSFPTTCQGPAQDLVKALLTKDPSERLPMRPPGFVKNLKTHEWYKGFDWDAMMRQELTPPYKPQVRGKKDIANFHARREDMPQHMEFKDDGSGWDAEFAS